MEQKDNVFDVLILGGGPAGLAAAVYAARSGAQTAVAESLALGGVAAATPQIENYPGFTSIAGWELGQRMFEHAESAGARFIYGKAESVQDGATKTVTLASGERLYAHALVLATGNEPRKLGIENEDSLLGAGLSYCATCDGNFFRGKTVAVAGGGSSAAAAAQYLLPLAAKVYAVHGGKLPETEGVERLENTKIVALNGMPLSSLTLQCGENTRELPVDGLFVCLGHVPSAGLVRGLVQTDDAGYIVCDERMQTSRAGIFAAGDARRKPLRQIVTAVSDGAIAGQFAAAYARKNK